MLNIKILYTTIFIVMVSAANSQATGIPLLDHQAIIQKTVTDQTVKNMSNDPSLQMFNITTNNAKQAVESINRAAHMYAVSTKSCIAAYASPHTCIYIRDIQSYDCRAFVRKNPQDCPK